MSAAPFWIIVVAALVLVACGMYLYVTAPDARDEGMQTWTAILLILLAGLLMSYVARLVEPR